MATQIKTTKKQPASPEQPRRKVGRPPKLDKGDNPRKVGRPRGVKSEAAKQTRLTTRRSGTSTRELIITSANEIINRTGVVDFRIETLAQSLSLSPGNITYHFPKKEDIITAIWEEYLAVMHDTTSEIITPLLDIKQLFLIFRTAAAKAINYVGVTTYYFGDMGALLRESEASRQQVSIARKMIDTAYNTLEQNGYMNPIPNPQMKELTFCSQMTMLRWWINHALTKFPEQDLPIVMDRYIALSLLQLLPYLTDAGRRQFESIANLIK